MKENYTYPVILDYSETDYINIIVPDLDGAMTSSERNADIIKESQDFLAILLLDFEDSARELPEASLDIKVEKDQKVIFVNVWMPIHRAKIKETFIKKTLTIPSWLDILAKQEGINFSGILVKALKEELKLDTVK
ncbi:type II toxin-antitoxin system HicB family antitoxin [Proteiniclasticum ruminis]|uniref:type II toxin-antitoxin system HicB family antitoxin n=1 Tax=Proteiniclasticum ruminis TaxID=398199 RepID=UPI0028ACD0B2|nr:type II toxin-antitoxin system HicB family antitoxin [Proteiniclasticum ruminis]